MRYILADMFGQIGSSASSSNNQVMSGIGSLFNGASSILSNSKEIKSKIDAGDKSGAYAQGIASAVSGAVEMFNLIYDQAQANKQALADWDEAIRSSAQKLRMLELEELNWKDRNIWGSADPYEKMNKSLEKANKASMMASDSLKKLADGQVQTGTKKVVDAKNTLQGTAIGAGIGASIGSIVPVIGTAIGTAVGAVAGTLAGLFAGRKEVAVYNSLQNQYGELYNKETLEINKQILADYDKMDEKTKKLIDDTKELLEAQKESLEEFKSYVIELTGDVSGGLSDSLVEAFSNNELYTAVDKFKEYMQTQIEGIIQSRVFSSVFGDMMDSLSKQLESGIISSEGAINGNIEEKLAEFPYRISELMGTYDYLMKSYQDIFKKGGYDLFKAQKEATQEALQGTISSMSEDTATKLNGNFMGLKLSAMEINQNVGTMRNLASEANEIMRSSLATMNRIAENTAFCQKLERLDELADDLSDMKRNGILVR